MVAVEAAEAKSGKGLVNDLSFGRSRRQVLLIDIETLKEFDLSPGDVKENLTVEGLPFTELAPKDRLEIGQALLEISGECSPCSMLDDIRPGLSAKINGRRGVLANVLRGGKLRVGDRIAHVSYRENTVSSRDQASSP